jgi:hypothetical protein
LTTVERKQPLIVFSNAGASAFRALIHIGNNPYTEKPYRQLWAKGWFAAKARHEGTTPKYTPKTSRTKKRTDAPVLSLNRLNKFNTRHRTQA